MEEPVTLYVPGENRERILLSQKDKDAISKITLGIEEVDEAVRRMAIPDIVETLQNGNQLNSVLRNKGGDLIGYIACEDSDPHEAYIKYLGSTKQTDRNLLKEIPAFFEHAKAIGYEKLNFHGWNKRLNKILERYGFKKIRTDEEGSFKADFFEKILE